MLLDDLMKKLFFVLISLTISIVFTSFLMSHDIAAQEEPVLTSLPVIRSVQSIDHIVAIVNEEVITRNELDEVIRTTVKQLQKQGVQLPPFDIIEKQLLERTIMNRAQLQILLPVDARSQSGSAIRPRRTWNLFNFRS